MRKKNYIFTNKKHSDKAIMSTILGMISLVSLGIVTYLSTAGAVSCTAAMVSQECLQRSIP